MYKSPPSSIDELTARAERLAGMTLGQLGLTGHAHKGGVGQLIEVALGADGGSHRGPDFRALGVELKTLPISARGKIVESTWVCTVDIDGICEQTFETSDLWHKLCVVLFVCVSRRATVRLRAVEALGEIGDPARDARGDIERLLEDRDPMVAREALRALRRIR